MLKKKLAALAASAFLISSTAAVAETAAPVSSLSVARSIEANGSNLGGNSDGAIPAILFGLAIFAVVLLVGASSDRDGDDDDGAPVSP